MRQKRRWGDNDKHYGPLTVSRGDYPGIGIMLDSGGNEDGQGGCHVRFHLGRTTILLELPNWIPDFRIKHIADTWDAATIARMGRNYYFEVFPREYGFSYAERSLHVHYGPQTHDSNSSKSKCYFLPWLEYRFVRNSWYGLNGEELRRVGPRSEGDYEFEQTMPKACFEFEDYDGKKIVAATHIEEREWKRGTGWFKWLSLIWPSKVRRSLDIRFSEEVGPEKGSWKGGTLGHGIEMLPGELHEEAFRRYCEQEHRAKSRRFKIKFLKAA